MSCAFTLGLSRSHSEGEAGVFARARGLPGSRRPASLPQRSRNAAGRRAEALSASPTAPLEAMGAIDRLEA